MGILQTRSLRLTFLTPENADFGRGDYHRLLVLLIENSLRAKSVQDSKSPVLFSTQQVCPGEAHRNIRSSQMTPFPVRGAW